MLKTLGAYVKEFKKASIATPLFMILEVIMEMLIPYLLASLIDKGVDLGDMNHILKVGAIMVVVAFIGLFAGLMGGKYGAKASTGFARNLRKGMFDKIQTYSFANIDKFSTAGLVTRLTTDVTNIQNAYQMILRMCMRSPSSLICAMVMAFVINAKIATIYLIAVFVLGIALVLIVGNATKYFRQAFPKYDELNAGVQENVSAIRVVKAYVREDYEKDKFKKASANIYNIFVKAEKVISYNSPVMQFTVYSCILLISWIGARMIISSGGTLLTTGELMSLLSYCMNILMSLMMLSMIFVMITMSMASAERIAEVLNETPDITNPENPVYEVKDGSIVFENVDFKYKKRNDSKIGNTKKAKNKNNLKNKNNSNNNNNSNNINNSDNINKISNINNANSINNTDKTNNSEDDRVLSGINISIKSGETIGIIGGTGSSKSSLVNLISRLYDVENGSVKVGGVDVRDYDIETLRDAVSVVLQKNVLFSGSILDNLRWGDKNATEEDCIRACKLACADEFIERFPDKYNTHIEQGGTNVSGGQKQRLCIARALLKKPKILILDDSTSAVDTATDAKIRKAFATEIPDTTKIIIAQRISSVQNADRIIVMENGKVNGFGTHEELVENNEIYRDVYESQTGGSGDFDENGGEA